MTSFIQQLIKQQPPRKGSQKNVPALVPEIVKFEKCVKYANEMTDDVIHSTQYYIMYINKATLVNLQCRSLKLGSTTAKQVISRRSVV